MATVRIIRNRLRDALDQEGGISLNITLTTEEGSSYTRMDFLQHNTGITETIWGTDPYVMLSELEELLES